MTLSLVGGAGRSLKANASTSMTLLIVRTNFAARAIPTGVDESRLRRRLCWRVQEGRLPTVDVVTYEKDKCRSQGRRLSGRKAIGITELEDANSMHAREYHSR